MKTLMIACLAALALTAGAFNASALTETDKAMGAGAFINPTGPVNGVWHDDGTASPDKR